MPALAVRRLVTFSADIPPAVEPADRSGKDAFAFWNALFARYADMPDAHDLHMEVRCLAPSRALPRPCARQPEDRLAGDCRARIPSVRAPFVGSVPRKRVPQCRPFRLRPVPQMGRVHGRSAACGAGRQG